MPNPAAHREDQRDHQIALEVRRCRVLAETTTGSVAELLSPQ
jgi:hypothetical protein